MFRDSVIHYFDLLRWLTGEDPVSVGAFGACLIDPGIGLEGDYDTTLVNLPLPGGALCHIASSRRSAEGADARIEVFGSEGVLRVANAPINLLEPPVAGIRHMGFPTRFEEAFRNELNGFIKAVSSGTPPEPGPEDGRRSLIIADAATLSASNGNARWPDSHRAGWSTTASASLLRRETGPPPGPFAGTEVRGRCTTLNP